MLVLVPEPDGTGLGMSWASGIAKAIALKCLAPHSYYVQWMLRVIPSLMIGMLSSC